MADRARLVWSMRLSSALRAAFACAIVGSATLYGPKFLTHEIKFAAFSYLTAVLIVSDAALGDTVKGCWHALCATAQVVPLAILVRWLVAPAAGVPISTAAAAAGVAAFAVAMPEWTHLTAKRISFGQIVLVCSDAVVNHGSSNGVMHPLYVAASTALGALASVLALLVPYPGLACSKVRKLCRAYAENATQRMNTYQRAVSAIDNHTRVELVSQAKPLSETAGKLLQSIRILQEGMRWERPWSCVSPIDKLEKMELQMRGAEYSLVSSLAFPIQEIAVEQLSNFLQGISTRIKEKIEQVSCSPPFHSKRESETREFVAKPSLPLESALSIPKHGWLFFYFSCIDMFLYDTFANQPESRAHCPETKFSITKAVKAWVQRLTSYERLEFAFKCSLSLGLSVLFGLIFDKENGCWAGLSIAISFVTGRQAIFTIANTRVQGTAIGSVYGVIGCFLFHHKVIRLLSLLPWIIFTNFLRYSKMYGQTGGVSAAIAALLILGRKHYGDPNEFALARLTEVFIGLSAFIVVELFPLPVRAATLAKNQLFLTLHSLQDCMNETGSLPLQKKQMILKFLELREKQRNLDSLVCQLRKLVAHAELEPNFWYLPFRASCYQKLVEALSNTSDLLSFMTYNYKMISELSEPTFLSKEFQDQINKKLKLFQETLTSSNVFPDKAISTESQAVSQGPIDENSSDIEAGIALNTEKMDAYITEQKEIVRTTQDDNTEGDKRQRGLMIQYVSATWFCINSLMKELEHIKTCIREIEHWDK